MSYEIMAPVGCRESLSAAIKAGAGSVYFGVGRLNMRAGSASAFTLDDLSEIAAICRSAGVRSYLTVNTIVYDEDMEELRKTIDAAVLSGISAVIASDVSVMAYCRRRGMEVHLSTQLNISNTEALRFWAQFADVAVLARELRLEQVAAIHEAIIKENICGPSGRQVKIEMFCHGALCMAVSGKCYLSLMNAGRSANRGQCVQVCRRSYTARDTQSGQEIEIDGPYIMSPKDLKTIRFIDRMMKAGVSVFKIEGRARGPEYVDTVVRCYKEAIEAVEAGVFTEERRDEWDERLARVFNRGFWDGYYQGQTLGEWNQHYGNIATERKTYAGRATKYYSRLGVGEFRIEAHDIKLGDSLMLTGPTTGCLRFQATELRYDREPLDIVRTGHIAAMPVPEKIRENDKLFIIEKNVIQ